MQAAALEGDPLSVEYRIDAEPEPGVRRFARKVVRPWTSLPPDSTKIVMEEGDNAMAIERLEYEVHVVTLRVFYGAGLTQQTPAEYRYRVRRLKYLNVTDES